LLVVHALPLSWLADAAVEMPRAGRLFVLQPWLRVVRLGLRLHLFVQVLCLLPDEHRALVPLLD
jgi:hypothetical protein